MPKNFFDNNQPNHNKCKICIFVLGILIVVLTITSIFSFLYIKGGLERQIKFFKVKYPFIEPTRIFTDNDNLIINIQPLREKLQSYENNSDYLISVYFEYLPTGANISVNKDASMWPASLIKIPVAMAAMKKVEKGEWKMTNELVLLDEDKDAEFGELYKIPSGTKFTIEKLFRETLLQSDNTAYFIFLRNLENFELEELYQHLGMNDILESAVVSKDAAADNRITAKKYSVFFRSLFNSTYFSPEYSQKFMEILAENPDKEFLASGLSGEIKFSHKTGVRTEDKSFADSGIVYVPGRPYILTVMIQAKKSDYKREEIGRLMSEISEAIYEYIANYKI